VVLVDAIGDGGTVPHRFHHPAPRQRPQGSMDGRMGNPDGPANCAASMLPTGPA
jgi:hypothetical protein